LLKPNAFYIIRNLERIKINTIQNVFFLHFLLTISLLRSLFISSSLPFNAKTKR